MQENNSTDKSNTAKGSKSGKKKHISPQQPKDLLTGSSFIARELVPQYLKLGVLNKRDAVAQYIASGVIDYGRQGKPYMESGETIAKALDIASEAFRDTVSDLKKAGIIGRTGKNGDRLRSRRWFIPAIDPFISLKMTAGINGGDRRCERRVTAGLDGGASAGVNGGLLRESGSDKIMDEENKEEEKTKTPPPVVSQDSIKKVTAEDAMGFLKPYALLVPKDFSQGYYDVIAKVSGCYHRTADDLDVTSAELFLKDFPSDFKRPEILANWIYWRACQLPAKWNKKTHFFTKFEDTWEAFRSQAETILKDLKEGDEERRKDELRQREEQAEAERMRQDAEDALWAAEEERLEREGRARQQTLHNAFVASLPAEDSIIPAVMAVPDPATLRRKDYVAWLDAMLKATGLMLVMKPDCNDWSYIRNAYKAAGLDPRKFISLTRDFVVAKAGMFLGRLKEDINIHKPVKCELKWDNYPDYFGADLFHPEACAFDIPKHLLDYHTPGPPIEAEESMLAARADQEEFDSRLED